MSGQLEIGAQPSESPVARVGRDRRAYDALIDRVSWWSLRILLVAAVLDALTTYISLDGPGARETNPLGRSMISELGLGGAMVVRVLIGVLYFFFLKWILDTQSHRGVRFAACLVAFETAAWWWIVVVNNFVVIAR